MEFSLENRKVRNCKDKTAPSDSLVKQVMYVGLVSGRVVRGVLCLVQLQHGLRLSSAPHVAHEEIPDADQIGGPGLLKAAAPHSQREATIQTTAACFSRSTFWSICRNFWKS